MHWEMGEKTMKKRVITVVATLALLIAFTAPVSYAADLLESKAVYYTEESDYIDGDCILTSTRMMIRRASIMHGRDGWSEITNETLRPAATEEGLLLYNFCYDVDDITFSISTGSFSGQDNYARIAEFESLLKDHPEGIVVWGVDAASTGTHGVLVVKVENGTVYAVDSSYNMGMFKEGIQKWTDTTMLDPSLATDYWYISDVSGGGSTQNIFSHTYELFRAHHYNRMRMRVSSI